MNIFDTHSRQEPWFPQVEESRNAVQDVLEQPRSFGALRLVSKISHEFSEGDHVLVRAPSRA